MNHNHHNHQLRSVPSDEQQAPEEWVEFKGESTTYFDNQSSSQYPPRKFQRKQPHTPIRPPSYYSQHQEAVECIYGSPKTPSPIPPKPKATTRNTTKPRQQVVIMSPRPNVNSPVISEVGTSSDVGTSSTTTSVSPQKVYFSPAMEAATKRNGSGDDHTKGESYDDDDSDEHWIPTKRHSYCKCFAIGLCLALAAVLFFLLSLSIGTLLRGEPLSFHNILFGYTEPTSSPTVSFAPSTSPSEPPTNPPFPPSNITVAAYYYPWHGSDFHGRKYLREKLNMEPTLGEYNDQLFTTIAQHLYWSRYSNIRVWITSWWGPNRREDDTIRNNILTHQHLQNHQIALLYETTGRIKASENYTTHRIVSDINYICEEYLDHPNYYRIQGRPVLFIYLTRKLSQLGILEEVLLLMRSTADNWGHDLFLIGDHIWQDAPNSPDVFRPFLYLDGMTNYDVYGSMTGREDDGLHAGAEAVADYYQSQKEWKHMAMRQSNCGYIPTVSPGFNDRGVRLEANHLPLSRKLTKHSVFGSLFQESLKHALPLVDSDLDNMLIVNSFNEWHEDTQIEPCTTKDTLPPSQQSSTTTTTTTTEKDYTKGVEYEGYGERYLTILRDMTTFEQDVVVERSGGIP
mmetsp:Transcript_1204/g.1537  ORF Transcript_1204/g.1537 Transcript_1204/m.1537 type:complete len:625 (+) Transcript_1204:312-2186(+)